MKFVLDGNPAYLIGSLFFILTWALLYWRAPKSRAAILWASVTLLPIGPFLESMYVIDYWRPGHLFYIQFGWLRLSLEDLIFTFTCAGICAGFFDLVYRRHHDRELTGITLGSYFRLLAGGGLTLAIIFGIWRVGHVMQIRELHSVNAHAIGCILALPFVCVRRRWGVSANAAALGGAAFMIIFYVLYFIPICDRFFSAGGKDIFQQWWLLPNLSGVFLFRIPIEEIYWMATTVLLIGPLVRFCMDVTEDKRWVPAEQFRSWREERKMRKQAFRH